MTMSDEEDDHLGRQIGSEIPKLGGREDEEKGVDGRITAVGTYCMSSRY